MLTITAAELKDNGVYKFIPINNETGENWFKFIVINDIIVILLNVIINIDFVF